MFGVLETFDMFVLTLWLPLTSLNVSGTLGCQPTHVYKRFGEARRVGGGGSLRGNQDSLGQFGGVSDSDYVS